MFFATAAAFGDWLALNADERAELVVGFHKVGSGTPCMRWSESVDEALCVGWIDGVRKRIDDRSYQIRFTPRRPGSIWSAINIAKVAALDAAGRMQPAGLAAFAARTETRSVVYSYEQDGMPELEPAEVRVLKADEAAWRYFQACPPGYRKQITHWVVRARQPATRARRLAALVSACAIGKRLR